MFIVFILILLFFVWCFVSFHDLVLKKLYVILPAFFIVELEMFKELFLERYYITAVTLFFHKALFLEVAQTNVSGSESKMIKNKKIR